MFTFSIIIPTYNRFNKLIKVLNSLGSQKFSKSQFEVIIVDDGSIDKNYENLEKLQKKYDFIILIIRQNNKGAATARNIGIKVARGEYVLFIGDDTYPEINLLSEHLKTHKSTGEKISVLGFVDWDRNLKLNDLMKFISPCGPQFDFRIKDIQNVGYKRFYTSNISIPSNILKVDKFYEGFSGCNLEDIELGYRLEKKGYKIYYNENAIVYHDHFYEDEASFIKRQESVGRNKKIFLNLHPELNNLWSNKFFLEIILIKDVASIFFAKIFKNKSTYLRSIFEIAYIKTFLKNK